MDKTKIVKGLLYLLLMRGQVALTLFFTIMPSFPTGYQFFHHLFSWPVGSI